MRESQLAGDKNVGGTDEYADPAYISPDKIEVVQFAPPAELAPYVTQIYFFRCDEAHIQDRQPAALGHLVFLLKGNGVLKFQDGHADTITRTSVFGPCMAAAEYTFEGPLHHMGFALTPLGFGALTGRPANLYADRAVPASQLFGAQIDELAETFRKGHASGTLRIVQMAEMATSFLLGQVKPVPPAHMTMIQKVVNWLSSTLEPNVEILYPQLDMSRSTAARLITRYFGSAPKQLMRKYRGVRAASLLCDPACTPELRAKVESLFYDQPHMIREIRQFAGRTPGALDGDDAKILRIWLSKDNYRDIETYPG
ncbi:MAG: helix-turn-helix domain-containing protein [Sphingorhabdus sp.]